jgi:hypothetical protein
MRQHGLDTARFLLRGIVGGTMVAHGIRHGRTLDGMPAGSAASGSASQNCRLG